MYRVNREDFLRKFEVIEKDTMVDYNGNLVTIGEFCRERREVAKSFESSDDALKPVLKTALVINWKEAAMKKRVKRFYSLFPEINSLEKMRSAIASTGPLVFCKKYLDIKANPEKPANNPKYRLLCELTFGFLEYMKRIQAESEMHALRHWANQVRIESLKKDFIGRRHGVGPGVVENIRLNLGIETVKPDRHVLGVLEKVFGLNDIKPHELTTLAKDVGINHFHFDRVIFEYGKKHGITLSRIKYCN